MGFRSTFTTESRDITWPDWFITKYADHVFFPKDNTGPLHSKHEAKTYMLWADLAEDIQRAVADWERQKDLALVFLHECGGITRVQISKDAIRWSEPEGWRETDGVEHHYCYGCSDLK